MMLRNKIRQLFSRQKLSHLKGSTTTPLLQDSISKAFFKSSLDNKDSLAVVSDFQNIKLTYQDLYSLSRRAAANFLDLGLSSGSKVGVFAPNYIEWVICQFACSLADLHLVNINPAYKPRELKHGLSLAEVETLIVSDNLLPSRILDNVEWLLSQENVELNREEDSGLVWSFIIHRTC